MIKTVDAAIKQRLEQVQSRLPPEKIPKSTTAIFNPKPDFKVFIDGHSIRRVAARLDFDGKITSVIFWVGGHGGEKQYKVKGIQDYSPSDIRLKLKYYTEHAWE